MEKVLCKIDQMFFPKTLKSNIKINIYRRL